MNDELEWAECLRRTLNRRDVLKVLRDIGLSTEDIAIATDADARTVRRWMDAQEPRRGYDEAIDRLRTAVLYLLQRRAMPTNEISLWLRSRSFELGTDPVLGVRRPLDALAEGGLADVLASADAFIRPAEGSLSKAEVDADLRTNAAQPATKVDRRQKVLSGAARRP